MASRKFFHAKTDCIYRTPVADHNLFEFEFEEADIYKSNEFVPMEANKSAIPSSRSSRKLPNKSTDDAGKLRMASASLPVNIPDWSKILKEEYREHGKRESHEDGDDDNNNNTGGDDDGDGYYDLVPPHEYLAMRRGASFSVLEGIGRTLKGRDLSRVRNAIWKKVGFED